MIIARCLGKACVESAVHLTTIRTRKPLARIYLALASAIWESDKGDAFISIAKTSIPTMLESHMPDAGSSTLNIVVMSLFV